MNSEAIPRPTAAASLDEIDGELVLFYPAGSKAVYVNRTAALVWQLCDGTRSVGELASVLEQLYPESDSVGSDLEQALRELADIRAIDFENGEAKHNDP